MHWFLIQDRIKTLLQQGPSEPQNFMLTYDGFDSRMWDFITLVSYIHLVYILKNVSMAYFSDPFRKLSHIIQVYDVILLKRSFAPSFFFPYE